MCRIAAESILLQNKHSNRRHVSSWREILHWTIQRIWISSTKFFNLCVQLNFLQSMRTTNIFYALPISLQVMTAFLMLADVSKSVTRDLHDKSTTVVLRVVPVVTSLFVKSSLTQIKFLSTNCKDINNTITDIARIHDLAFQRFLITFSAT